ncbi:hypothetical protein BKA70DRAFT_29365 [Coprinopsis sp. MPI-PUGE-AT-0042]|nr:hypothetical protein BKA70DRAFT_29365 [Coprinopsis sp. MPI-PUGE-AT-0042]
MNATDLQTAAYAPPIRRVPHDVLALIFLTCVETMEQPYHRGEGVGLSRKHPSVVLSHVSTEWRSLALDTPLLWSQMHIKIHSLSSEDDRSLHDPYTHWCKNMDALKDSIRTWARRSSPCPIHVRLDNGSGDWLRSKGRLVYLDKAQKVYKSVTDAIRDTLPRLQTLFCSLDFDPLSKGIIPVFNHPPEHYPALQKVEICGVSDPDQASTLIANCLRSITSGSIFSAPLLCDLSVFGLWGDISAAKIGSTPNLYQAITHLKLNGDIVTDYLKCFETQDALNVLRYLPNLVDCDLQLSDPAPRPIPVLQPPVRLPHLKALALELTTVAKGFAPSLDLPSLESLDFNCYQVEEDPDYTPQTKLGSGMVEFVQQVGHQLTFFSCYPEAMTRNGFSFCMMNLPNVTRLKLHSLKNRHPKSDEQDLFVLRELNNCPKLEDLHMTDLDNGAADGRMERAVVDFIVARRKNKSDSESLVDAGNRPFAHLRKLDIQFTMETKLSIRDELDRRGVDMTDFELVLFYLILRRYGPELPPGWVRRT